MLSFGWLFLIMKASFFMLYKNNIDKKKLIWFVVIIKFLYLFIINEVNGEVNGEVNDEANDDVTFIQCKLCWPSFIVCVF